MSPLLVTTAAGTEPIIAGVTAPAASLSLVTPPAAIANPPLPRVRPPPPTTPSPRSSAEAGTNRLVQAGRTTSVPFFLSLQRAAPAAFGQVSAAATTPATIQPAKILSAIASLLAARTQPAAAC